MRDRRVLQSLWICGALMLCQGQLAAQQAPDVAPDTNQGRSLYSYDRTTLTRIKPAIEIPDGLPAAGWNHMLMLSRPRLTDGELDQLPAAARHYSDLFFTVIAARTDTEVAPEGTRYVLDDIGIGLGTRVKDREVTVSRETLEEQEAAIGLLGPMALAAAEQRLQEVKLVARSPTMGLVDVPAVLVHQGENIAAVLRHAVLVDPRNGRVDTLLWEISLNDAGQYREVRGPIRVLPLRLEFENQLRVDINRFRLAMPEPTAFATLELPRGLPVPHNEELAELAALPRMTPAVMYHLEVRLWDALYQAVRDAGAADNHADR